MRFYPTAVKLTGKWWNGFSSSTLNWTRASLTSRAWMRSWDPYTTPSLRTPTASGKVMWFSALGSPENTHLRIHLSVDFALVEHAEADTFFCFTNLMSENRDNFIKSLDDSQCGITFKMESVFSKLKEKDTELYMKLVKNESTRVFQCRLVPSTSVRLSVSKSRTSSLSISPSAGWRCCSLRSFCFQTSSGFGIHCFQIRIGLSFSYPSAVPCWCTSATCPSPDSYQHHHSFQSRWLSVCACFCRLIRDQLLSGDFTANMRLLQVTRVHAHLMTVCIASSWWVCVCVVLM